jgi:hypothetical protein
MAELVYEAVIFDDGRKAWCRLISATPNPSSARHFRTKSAIVVETPIDLAMGLVTHSCIHYPNGIHRRLPLMSLP